MRVYTQTSTYTVQGDGNKGIMVRKDHLNKGAHSTIEENRTFFGDTLTITCSEMRLTKGGVFVFKTSSPKL